jgi:hypothetical protein
LLDGAAYLGGPGSLSEPSPDFGALSSVIVASNQPFSAGAIFGEVVIAAMIAGSSTTPRSSASRDSYRLRDKDLGSPPLRD